MFSSFQSTVLFHMVFWGLIWCAICMWLPHNKCFLPYIQEDIFILFHLHVCFCPTCLYIHSCFLYGRSLLSPFHVSMLLWGKVIYVPSVVSFLQVVIVTSTISFVPLKKSSLSTFSIAKDALLIVMRPPLSLLPSRVVAAVTSIFLLKKGFWRSVPT